jgi:hypothetical protein
VSNENNLPLGFGVLHDNYIDNLTPLLKVLLEGVLSSLVVKTANEQLAELLGLRVVISTTIVVPSAPLLTATTQCVSYVHALKCNTE